jgi:hypothetical protein
VAPVAGEFRAMFGTGLHPPHPREAGSGAVLLDATGAELELDGFQHWGTR